MAMTFSLSTLSSVTAKRSSVSCQARSILPCHSTASCGPICDAFLQRSPTVVTRAISGFGSFDQIFVGDFCDRAGDGGFGRFIQFDKGQTGRRTDQAEQAQRIFQRGRALASNRNSRFCR